MSTHPLASGHARSKWLSIDGASRQLSRRVTVVLCVVTHSLSFAFSSVDKSAQFLCLFRQPPLSLPDAPCAQANPFVKYEQHSLGSGYISTTFIHWSFSRMTPLTFLKKPLARTSAACSLVNITLAAQVLPSCAAGFSLSYNVLCYMRCR